MSRWIDADAMIAKMPTVMDMQDTYLPIHFKELLIDSAPSIDIVRCKECEYKSLCDGETKYYYCALEDRPNRQWSVDDTDFCSWGERKDEPQKDEQTDCARGRDDQVDCNRDN